MTLFIIFINSLFRFNITTGKYPFEGDNIFKLFEKIGEGVFEVPEEVDPLLGDLLQGMLHKDPFQRSTLPRVRSHGYVFIELLLPSNLICTNDSVYVNRWFAKKHPRNEPAVKIPPLRGDENRDMTVIESLECHHNYNTDDDDCSDSHYFTEHDVHGNYFCSRAVDELLRSLFFKFP